MKIRNGGFTLIEVLVVVLIIGILAAVAWPQYQKAVEKSRLAEALTNIDTVMKNVELRVLEKGTSSDADDYLNHENWSIDLSGGEWAETGSYLYFTKNFVYSLDDVTGIGVYRCSGTCTAGTYISNSQYGLFQGYRAIGETYKYCEGYTSLGKSICKSLTAQGWEDESN